MFGSSKHNNIRNVFIAAFAIAASIYFYLFACQRWEESSEIDAEYFLRAPVELYQGNPFYPTENPPRPVALPTKFKAQKYESKKFDLRVPEYFSQGSSELGPAMIYNPYPMCTKERMSIRRCETARGFGDIGDQVLAYFGTPKNFPKPLIGSYDVLGLDEVSFDRYGRYGAYGYGENDNSTWEPPSRVDWANINWGRLQDQCFENNKNRFRAAFRPILSREQHSTAQIPLSMKVEQKQLRERTAMILRGFTDMTWMANDIYNLRSLITELSLHSGGEYEVFLLIHVKNETFQLPGDAATVKDQYIPKEFHDISVLFNDATLEEVYPDVSEHRPIFQHFQPVQYFSKLHPEFDYYWQMEMDSRNTGHHYHFLEKLSSWSTAQPRKGLWERNARFYIPSIHGSWNDFAALVDQSNNHEGILGPVATTDVFPLGPMPLPSAEWGVGEEADLITLFPMIDPVDSGWSFSHHIYNYTDGDVTPRRASPGTMSRCSRQLLDIMHDAQLRGMGLHSEMSPASFALHHGLKAVYAPQPVFVDGRWSGKHIDKVFNSGPAHNPHGGETSFLGWSNVVFFHKYFRRFSFLWAAAFPQELYRSWMGWDMYQDTEDVGRGKWEETEHGRMVLPGMFLHPIKDLSVEPMMRKCQVTNSFDNYRVG